jgi:glycosyltransferase involved in cell wall biosynthesis
VISNGIDAERFSPGPEDSDLRRRLGFDLRPVVLYTGRLDAEKEMDVWLRAAAAVSQTHDVQFAVGGEGMERSRLETLAEHLGIRDRTRFIGYVVGADLPSLYRLADLYLITSPVELQSIATLEAAASGLPVVAADAAALPELVKDGWNGYLVVDGDWEGAARAVRRILNEPHVREVMASRSRELAEAHALSRTVDAYERLLGMVSSRAARDRPVGRLTAAGR